MNTKKILILSSNPRKTTVLDIDIEMREIREALRRAENCAQFSLEFRVAVRPRDLSLALLEVKPNIVHFCGHGTGSQGIVLENKAGDQHLVETETLTELLKIVDEAEHSIECVILNACYSEVQAKEIVKHIDYVVGMNQAIPDKVARIITVAPTNETYKDGASLVTVNTKISNGHLEKPQCDRREDINDPKSWIKVEQSSNELDWQKLFDRAKSIAEDVSNRP
ncbi:MAG: CHAT domain-containing protein [Cyanobacteria bacterium P01_A01_bin.83]